MAKFEPVFRRVVRQELEAKLGLLQSSQRCSLVNQPESSASRTFGLTFANELPSTLFTNSRIHAEGHSFVSVQLIDANSREVVSYAPFGSVRVEILVLSGDFAVDGQEDWSIEAFNDGIVCQRDGRRPLLVGEISFSLSRGVGFIKNVSFTDNSSWIRSRRFRLGVRAVPSTLNGIGIKEGVSEAFVVLDHRGESYRKHDIPCLHDPVWRLKKISKNGAICRKLAEKGIHTVKDFLQLYHINPNLLRNIVGSGIANKAWETMVKHANACCLDNNWYTYYHAANGVGLLLNSVYSVLEVTFDGVNYQSIDALNLQQRVLVEQVKQYIYHNLNMLCPTNGSSCNYLSMPSQFQKSAPFSAPALDPWGNSVPITDQGELLDISHSDASGSNPCMANDTHQLEEDITAPSSQPIEGPIWGSSSWDSIDSTVMTLPPTPLIMDETFPQPSIWQPVVTTWATTSSSNSQFSPSLHSFGINLRGGGKSKARWGKIRALLMWTVVKRAAAAKRKAKFPFGYYQGQFA